MLQQHDVCTAASHPCLLCEQITPFRWKAADDNVYRQPPGQMSAIKHAYEEVRSYACQQCVHGPHIILLRGDSPSLCTAAQVLVNQHCLMFAQMLLIHAVPAVFITRADACSVVAWKARQYDAHALALWYS